jgi:hypothetical protein
MKKAYTFIKKYYADCYSKNEKKADEYFRRHPDRKEILTELGEAMGAYEFSKSYSAAGEQIEAALMGLLSLMNEVLFSEILYVKDSHSLTMNPGESFMDEVKIFLVKLCDLCNYDTKKSVDAYEVGRELNLGEQQTERIVNYSLNKEWIWEPDRTFDRISTGDPAPSRKFRFIYITSRGIDVQFKKERERPDVPTTQHFGDTYHFEIVNSSSLLIVQHTI